MKVAITGKGGVGKTTFASTLARLYADEGRTVLAADVDPDANLGLALGLTEEEVNQIVPIAKMKELAKERTAANQSNTFYKLNPQVSDLPDKLSKDINGVKLLVMGTIDTGGTGCVCPEHVMLKSILSSLVFRKDDVVIMDMEAGLEHLGRGTERVMGISEVEFFSCCSSLNILKRRRVINLRHRQRVNLRISGKDTKQAKE